jgi:hypothetical protein
MVTRYPIAILSIVGFITAACQPDTTAPDAAATAKPTFSAVAQTQNSTFDIDQLFFVPCANGGLGEDVELTGTIHDLFHVTADGRGGFHVKLHDSPQGVIGTGLTTGARYHGTGVTQSHFNLKVGEQSTDINNFRIIGPGPGNNFLLHENFHVTINANGVVTAGHDNFSVQCN